MSKTLTFELPDEIYDALEHVAAQGDQPVEELALEWLSRHAPQPRRGMSDEELKLAAERLRGHAGAVDSGDPHSADNERIDADPARESRNHHEETS